MSRKRKSKVATIRLEVPATLREDVERDILSLLRWCRKSTGSARTPSSGDYGQAFGLAQMLRFVGIYKLDPNMGVPRSEFNALVDLVEAEAAPQDAARRKVEA